MPNTRLLHLWTFRALWIGLPLALISPIESNLESHSSAITWLVAVTLWSAWGGGLVGLLVPNPLALTALRLLALAALAVIVATAFDGQTSWLGLAWAASTFAWSLLSSVGDHYVNGSSYGDERRFALKVPGQLLMGPIPLVAIAVLAGISVGPLLLAAESWPLGAVASILGFYVGFKGFKILHQLSQRWLIFVPTGIVLIDSFQLRDPLRMHHNDIDTIAIADADTDATDLTNGTLGRAIQIRLDLVHPITKRSGDAGEVTALLVAPSRLLDAVERANPAS